MENEQMTPATTVAIAVIDRPDLSFSYAIDTGVTESGISGEENCRIEVSEVIFNRLLDGTSTFEQEVSTGKITISGDSRVLRDLGKVFR